MKSYIKAISYYLPENVLTNEQLTQEFPEWTVEKIASKIGVNERRIASENETALDMGVKSAEKLHIACGFGVGLSWGSVFFETDKIVVSELLEI